MALPSAAAIAPRPGSRPDHVGAGLHLSKRGDGLSATAASPQSAGHGSAGGWGLARGPDCQHLELLGWAQHSAERKVSERVEMPPPSPTNRASGAEPRPPVLGSPSCLCVWDEQPESSPRRRARPSRPP